jgi:hypothetical protein
MSGPQDDLDAPKPPGGPQRSDAPDGPETPGTEAPDPGPETTRVTRPEGTGSVPPAEGDEKTQDAEEAGLQEENAGTSQDQPST